MKPKTFIPPCLPFASIGLLTLFFPLFGAAQQQQTRPANYAMSYWYNGVELLKSPLRFNKEQWITASGSLAFVASMVAIDEPVNIPMSRWNTTFANEFGKAGDRAGGGTVQLGISGGAIMAGALFQKPGLLHFGLDNLQSQVFTAGITYLFKNLTHRPRPETGNGAFRWYGPLHGWGNLSFFSGHTSMAFSTANMIFLHSKKKWWVGVLSFGAASAIGVSRMQLQKHWSSDVVMGALMGTAISSWVYHQQEKRRLARRRIPAPGR